MRDLRYYSPPIPSWIFCLTSGPPSHLTNESNSHNLDMLLARRACTAVQKNPRSYNEFWAPTWLGWEVWQLVRLCSEQNDLKHLQWWPLLAAVYLQTCTVYSEWIKEMEKARQEKQRVCESQKKNSSLIRTSRWNLPSAKWAWTKYGSNSMTFSIIWGGGGGGD